MKAVEIDSDIELANTTIPHTVTMDRGQPHTRVLEKMSIIQSDDSDSVDSNRSDVDDDCISKTKINPMYPVITGRNRIEKECFIRG